MGRHRWHVYVVLTDAQALQIAAGSLPREIILKQLRTSIRRSIADYKKRNLWWLDDAPAKKKTKRRK